MKVAGGENGLYLSWWRMSIIRVAGMVCLPVFIVGAEIGRKYGLLQAALAILTGNLCLFLLGLMKCSMAFKNKNNTMENASTYFGVSGTKIFALTIIASLVGWFAIQLDIMATGLERLVLLLTHNAFVLPTFCYNIFLGGCITLLAVIGMKGFNKLATISAPILFSTIVYGLFVISKHGTPISSQALMGHSYSFQGISLVIATAIIAIIDLPTYYRYSRTLRDGQITLFINFLVALPILEFAGAFIATKLPGENFMDMLSSIGGHTWQVWIALFLIFASWTTNNNNLYSAAVALEKLCLQKDELGRFLIIGLIGTAISCLNLFDFFSMVLRDLGILVSNMGAVMGAVIICNYIYHQVQGKEAEDYGPALYLINIASWLVGSFFAICHVNGLFTMTGIEFIDAFIVGSLCTFALLSNRTFIERILENNIILQRTTKGNKV